MRTFVPDRTCWSLLLTALAIILRYKPTYDKLRVLISNKDIRKSLAHKNGNESPIWSWNDSPLGTTGTYRKIQPIRDAALGKPHYCDDDPTTYIDACLVVGLPPLGGEASGQVLQFGLRLGK